MTSYVLTVNEKNVVAKRLLDYLKSLSKINDHVCIEPQTVCNAEQSVTLSDEEMKLVEKSLKSGICKDTSSLREYIKSQI